MCDTPEKAAWEVLLQQADKRDHRIIAEIIRRNIPDRWIKFDIYRDVSRGCVTIKAGFEAQISDELIKAVREEMLPVG